MENFQADIHPLDSLFRYLVENDPAFDVHQRDCWGRTLLMQTCGQPRKIYKELLQLSRDADALDKDRNTVLHHFFWNNYNPIRFGSNCEAFLDGGDILALLIRAGADPQAMNRFGQRPQDDICSPFHVVSHLDTIRKWINLAFWHEALRICGLSGSEYCDCPAHHGNNTSGHDSGLACQSCPDGLNESLRFNTFEEEMSAAFQRWDKNAAQEFCQRNGDDMPLDTEFWEECDEMIHEVLSLLQSRQKDINPDAHTDPIQLIKDRFKDGEDNLEGDETQISGEIRNLASRFSAQDIDSVDEWETSSSTSSEEGWESAAEM